MARAQMEMGGKNPTIVLADADLDLAARLVGIAGFGLTGQACTATSRVIVEKSVVEAFAAKLIEKARAIAIGNGLKQGITMGPAVSEAQLKGNLNYIEIAQSEGASLLYGGGRLTDGDLAHGFFMQPTVLGNVKPTARIACEEVFGPVVGIIPVENFIEAGVVKINQISTGLALQAPFGGVKKSSTDSFKEQGPGAIEFYSKLKTVYLDYSA